MVNARQPERPTARSVIEARMRGEQFSGNRKRVAAGSPIAPLQFGPHGELTPKTIKAANLTKEEEKRAFEMLKVQAAFVEIMDVLSYPVDPDGNVHDLTAIKATKIAIAWTLALNGFRSSGKKYIKKRPFAAPGCYADAHTWVDVRSPDDAAEELEPEHKSSDQTLPPDTRRLAAIRDGDPGQKLPQWAVKPKIVYDDEPRPADLPERPKPEPAKPESA